MNGSTLFYGNRSIMMPKQNLRFDKKLLALPFMIHFT